GVVGLGGERAGEVAGADDLAVDADLRREDDVGGRAADHEPLAALLDDHAPGDVVPVGEVVDGDGEAHRPRLAGGQAELLEAAELAQRLLDARAALVRVELDDLDAVASAGVGDVDGDGELVAGGGV